LLAHHTPAPKSKSMIISATLDWHERQGRIEYRRYAMHLPDDIIEKLMVEDEGVYQLIKDGIPMMMATVGAFRSLLVQIHK